MLCRRETNKIDTAIHRLKNYCSALITAVVTGQIDVRSSAKYHEDTL